MTQTDLYQLDTNPKHQVVKTEPIQSHQVHPNSVHPYSITYSEQTWNELHSEVTSEYDCSFYEGTK